MREEDAIAKIPLMRSGGNFGTVSVLYTITNNSATEGLDYIGNQGEVIFPDGTREATLDVTIRDDPEMENAESFTVELVSTTGWWDTMLPRKETLKLLSLLFSDVVLIFYVISCYIRS